ncbi:hypothetical protein EMIT0P2_20379 [Pseudomonas sp. IT-P2]
MRAYYSQTLLIRQARGYVLFFTGCFEALKRGDAFPDAPLRSGRLHIQLLEGGRVTVGSV